MNLAKVLRLQFRPSQAKAVLEGQKNPIRRKRFLDEIDGARSSGFYGDVDARLPTHHDAQELVVFAQKGAQKIQAIAIRQAHVEEGGVVRLVAGTLLGHFHSASDVHSVVLDPQGHFQRGKYVRLVIDDQDSPAAHAVPYQWPVARREISGGRFAKLVVLSDSPPLLARGTLGKTPLADFLVKALDESIEGTLILQRPGGQKNAVLFHKGAPAKARLDEPSVYLGEVLVDLELIPRSVAVSTRKRSDAGRRSHGEILLEEGHIDQTGLYVGLREQLKRQVLTLCDLPAETIFGLYKANYLAKWGPAGEWRVKPLPLVWRALADHLPEARRTAVLEHIRPHQFRMRTESPVNRYQLTREELSVVNVLRAKPQTLTELEKSGAAGPEIVRRVACALVLSRQLESFSRDKEPVGYREPPESPQSVAPPQDRASRRPTSTVPRASRLPGSRSLGPPSKAPSKAPAAPGEAQIEFRAEVEAYERDPPVTFYDLLGIPAESDADAVRRAFFALARRWHPDKLPKELEDLRPIVHKAFSRMAEAHQVLSDPLRRRDYEERLNEAPEEEQEKVAAVLEAAAAYQRAQILLKKKDLKSALREAEFALETDPEQADHLALCAWIRACAKEGDLSVEIGNLDRALEQEPNNIRALWYRGQLLKRSGKSLTAMRDFKNILKIKPNHVEAKRELRVHQMRKRSDQQRSTPGFLGRLLKKD